MATIDDDNVLTFDSNRVQEPESKPEPDPNPESPEPSQSTSTGSTSTSSNSITETITVPFSADIPASRHAKILRQTVNILHALLSNSMRYAAIGDGNNAGAGFGIHQQTYTAAANLDAAAKALEEGQRQVLVGGGPMSPNSRGPHGGGMIGRA